MSKINTQIHSYWSRQLSELKKEGWVAVRRKTVTVIVKLLKLPIDLVGFVLAVPVVLFVRLIRPIKLIRFGYFFAGRIGHFSFDVEYYLTEKKLGFYPENAIDLFFYRWLMHGKPANDFFSQLTKRHLKIFSIVRYLFFVNSFIPGGEKNQILPAYKRYGSRDIRGIFNRIGPQLSFTRAEETNGQAFFKLICKEENAQFICLNIRDSSFLRNADYHNYRDSDIDTYEEAALALAERGYWVFRMGKVVQKPFKVSHSRIIDYANSEFRSDFLDIWLMANCFFTISSSSGLDNICVIHRKPILLVNHLPVGDCRTGSSKNMEVFKKLRWKQTGKYLSLEEQINCGAIWFLEKNKYEKLGIEILDNTSVELKSAVLEFEKQLNKKNNDLTIETETLQKQFWKILSGWRDYSKYHGNHRSTISNSFLFKHQDWFLS